MTAERMMGGDIFRWRWTEEKEEAIKKWKHDAYWCQSGIAIYMDGHLRDTYWGSSSDSTVLCPTDVVLTFLGNPNDMKKIPAYERVFYRDEDVVDMRHANNSGAPVYVKAGRDAETMKQYFAYEIDRTEREITWAHRRIKECQEYLARIERGEVDGSFATYK